MGHHRNKHWWHVAMQNRSIFSYRIPLISEAQDRVGVYLIWDKEEILDLDQLALKKLPPHSLEMLGAQPGIVEVSISKIIKNNRLNQSPILLHLRRQATHLLLAEERECQEGLLVVVAHQEDAECQDLLQLCLLILHHLWLEALKPLHSHHYHNSLKPPKVPICKIKKRLMRNKSRAAATLQHLLHLLKIIKQRHLLKLHPGPRRSRWLSRDRLMIALSCLLPTLPRIRILSELFQGISKIKI